MDKLKAVFDGLLRATKQLHTADDYSPPLGDSLLEAVDKLNIRFDKMRQKENDNAFAVNGESRIPATIQQATAEICLEGAELLASNGLYQSGSDLPAGKNNKYFSVTLSDDV